MLGIRVGRAERLFVVAILRRDRRALVFTLAGCALSAAVAVFQFAVFTSFLTAAAVIPSRVGAAAWVMGHGVAAFDFPYPISRDYAGLVARCFPGAAIDRVLFGFAPWTSPTGTRGNVAVVGIEDSGIRPRAFVVDDSDRARLELGADARDAEIGGVAVSLQGFDRRLATFLGAPYALLDVDDAARALALPPDRVSFLAVHQPGASPEAIAQQVRCASAAFPELTIASGAQFSRSSSFYWVMKTGAGAAILIASALASILMVVILVNGIGRFCQRRHADFLTMLSLGAESSTISGILACIVGVFAIGSVSIAVAILPLADRATEPIVPWVEFKLLDLGFAIGIAIVGALVGFAAARRQAVRLEVVDVFRAA